MSAVNACPSLHNHSADKTRVAVSNNHSRTKSADQTKIWSDKTQISHKAQNKKPRTILPPQAINDALFTKFDCTNHSNSVGILAARTIFQKALQDKGKILNKRFVLEDVLGFGGMGVVYRAKDLRRVEAEDPSPYVAIKVLNDDFENHPDAFVALQQETVKSQILAHPNIVTVHDFDRDGNLVYMTMELLKGNPLDTLIKKNYRNGMPSDDAISIFNDISAGLSYAHKHNVIHSDFKPLNVFITYSGLSKILDFGIARICANNDINCSSFDAGNLGAITVEYASLEMIEKKPPHFSDDIYALACVFYVMLTGSHPYNRIPANKALKRKLKPQRIENLSNRQWKALEKALALESKHRFQSVEQFKKAFHHKPKKTLTKVAGVFSIALIALAMGFGLATYQPIHWGSETPTDLPRVGVK